MSSKVKAALANDSKRNTLLNKIQSELKMCQQKKECSASCVSGINACIAKQRNSNTLISNPTSCCDDC
ncbi:unnamed protein product [Bursaphelenchus okinawaensis]|uniref:Uncharacterized protein n=1 Tax=Bursaphelenchus okinawaensis TaxID=465554 RepID=A0A811K1G3_9BILA|nr:unnamed protein product [Bursaphelenchus okinawaensis]CAG9089950.1 unnamed protein product [Bursaphelenchus okinawaensis]